MHIPEWFPFLAMVAGQNNGPKMSVIRVVEALIIAGVTGGITTGMLTVRLDERLAAYREQQQIIIQQLRHDNEEMRRVLDKFSDQLIDHLTAYNERKKQ